MQSTSQVESPRDGDNLDDDGNSSEDEDMKTAGDASDDNLDKVTGEVEKQPPIQRNDENQNNEGITQSNSTDLVEGSRSGQNEVDKTLGALTQVDSSGAVPSFNQSNFVDLSQVIEGQDDNGDAGHFVPVTREIKAELMEATTDIPLSDDSASQTSQPTGNIRS
jgi:hypothetical protein